MWRRRTVCHLHSGRAGQGDDSRPEDQDKEVFVVINFTQGTQHVALPRELRALPGGLQESTLELPSNGIEELFVED